MTLYRGAENVGTENTGVENVGAIKHGKPSEKKTIYNTSSAS